MKRRFKRVAGRLVSLDEDDDEEEDGQPAGVAVASAAPPYSHLRCIPFCTAPLPCRQATRVALPHLLLMAVQCAAPLPTVKEYCVLVVCHLRDTMAAGRSQYVVEIDNAAAHRLGMAASRRGAFSRDSLARHASRATSWGWTFHKKVPRAQNTQNTFKTNDLQTDGETNTRQTHLKQRPSGTRLRRRLFESGRAGGVICNARMYNIR